MVEAAILVFPSATAGAGFVAAYFGGLATKWRLCILCIIVHGWRIFVLGWFGDGDFFYFKWDPVLGGRGRGCLFDDVQGGFQAGGSGGFGITEDGVEGLEGAVEAVLGLVAE